MGFRSEHREGSDPTSFTGRRNAELRALLLTSFILLFGLWLVFQAKSERPTRFAEVPQKLTVQNQTENGRKTHYPGELLNLNQVKRVDELIPYLTIFEKKDELNFASEKIAKELLAQHRHFKNVGALGNIRISEEEVKGAQGLESFKARLENAKLAADKRKAEQQKARVDPIKWLRSLVSQGEEKKTTITIPLIQQIGSIKSSFIVRSPEEFRNSLILFSAIFVLGFWGAHLYWRIRNFKGDQIILPIIFALCSLGFLMMVSLRDPLRDTLSFADFAWGVLLGSIAVTLLTAFDYHQLYYSAGQKRSARVDVLITTLPIGLSLLLCSALIIFGKGPGFSDAKVNLNIGFLFQPSELIKILVCLFIAAYFGKRWELIQNLDEKRFRFLSVPRLKDVWIVFVCVAMVLGLFLLQKDLGPALLMAGLFLIIFAIVRSQILLPLFGFFTIIGGYLFNYYGLRFSQIAADRLDIWRSPWDTRVSGGEQIVQSFWALATGGFSGTGLGLGDPRFAPASHTDLILSSLGEEFGFLGLLFIFALYVMLFYRCFKIALNSGSSYALFLALGITIINILQILFISAGVLGLIPLSGVVSPFLSYGSTSMVINFIAFGLVLVISAQKGDSSPELKNSFARPSKYLASAFGILSLFILANAAWIQLAKADQIIVKSVLAPQPDEVIKDNEIERTFVGVRRYQENPRIRQILRELPYGTIYDRNGIPIASSNWKELNDHRQEYESLGLKLEGTCRKGVRCYPLGAATFFLLGDVRTRKNWGGLNDFIEKEYQAALRGFDDHQTIENIEVKEISIRRDEQSGEPLIDPATNQPEKKEEYVPFPIVRRNYAELLPLIRYRYLPVNLEALRLRYQERDLHTSVDARLQIRLTQIVRDALETKGLTRAAVVVLEPQTGDLLASVSYPFPETTDDYLTNTGDSDNQDDASERLLDRARWQPYPPGSTFKLVVEMAALRKDANAFNQMFTCVRLDGGRVGNYVRGKRVRDDGGDKDPHGPITFKAGLIHSCNAYFAQLGEIVGGADVVRTADLFGIKVGTYYPQSAFGQGEVVATPFQMAKVAATVSNAGMMPFGRWVTDSNNLRNELPREIVTPAQAAIIAEAMRGVVTEGTAERRFQNFPVQVAGKTGTSQNVKRLDGRDAPLPPHSWFMGFAPYDKQKRIAFAVIVENGGYGAAIAADISKELVEAAGSIGLID